MRRGRPKHPDILTPREWEVLALLRDGLTNPQIAERLGISENGAKYHVLEILTKLGVSSRYEAAAWQREPAVVSRRYSLLPLLLALRPPKLGALNAAVSKLGVAVLAASVAGFLGVLAAGVVIMDQRASNVAVLLDQGVEAAGTLRANSQVTSPVASTASPEPSPTLLSQGAIVPPPPTEGPSATPGPTATAPPGVIPELPAGAVDALATFAVGQGTTFAGPCASLTPAGALCYNPNDGTPLQEGASIRVFMRVWGASLSYEVIVSPDGTGAYTVTAASGPNPFSIPPP